MKIRLSVFYGLFYSIIIFVFSLFIFQYYVDGDQRFYTPFYNYCLDGNFDIHSKFECYKEMVGSQEPIYFLISYIFSFFSSKIFFTSITNAILTFLLIQIIFKYYRVGWDRHIFIFLIIFNYYMLGLYFSTERLKFGFIFFFVALCINYKRPLFFLIAVLSHIQMLFAVVPVAISYLINTKLKFWLKALMMFFSIIGSSVVFLLLKDQIFFKFNAYYQDSIDSDLGGIGVVKTSFFIILAALCLKKWEPLIVGFPVVVMSFFIGSTRLGLMAFLIYLIYIIKFKHKMDNFLLMILLYFLYKSFGFISNVFVYGEGWNPIA